MMKCKVEVHIRTIKGGNTIGLKKVVRHGILLGILSTNLVPKIKCNCEQIPLYKPKLYESHVFRELKKDLSKESKQPITEEEFDKNEDEDIEVYIEPYVDMATPNNNSFKSYMDYRALSNTLSAQYQLQQVAYTDMTTGIRMIDDRYCVAVGSYYTTNIGVKLDLIMENGAVIPCVLADCKADIHTDSTNRQNPNGSIVEFVVDTLYISSYVKRMGDLSYIDESLFGEVDYIRVYE